MQRISIILVVLFVCGFYAHSWGTCPEDTVDQGECDTVYIEPWPSDTLLVGDAPYFVRVPIYATHDVPDPLLDSIAGFQIPLCYTHSNPANYCSLSGYWNITSVSTSFRSIFRHLVVGTDTTYNWMLRQKELGEDLGEDWVWSNLILNLDGTSYFWLLLAPTVQPLFGQGSRALLSTMTFKLEDSMQVCIDTCLWPPSNCLRWARRDSREYTPRLGTPHDPASYKVCFNIDFSHRPVANFSAEPECGFVPLTVHFTDLSSGNPTSWFWKFGDNSTSTEQNPVHVYQSKGTYYPTLIASNPSGSDTLTSTNPIIVYNPLTIGFTANPAHGRKPLNVSFHSSFNETPETMTWDFGDGQTSINPDPVHKYSNAGTYDVKLVAELCAHKDSLIKEDYIQVSDIKAEFAADKRCGIPPLTVTFSDGSTSSHSITSWHWDFGDGGTSILQNPTHQFTGTNAFDVTLIVSDGIGDDTLRKQGYISTQDSVSADFIGVPKSGRSPLSVMFEPVLEGIANEYFWEFGDGESSTLRNPIHTYATQGKYDVKLRTRLQLDDCSQVDSMTKQDYVIVNDLDALFKADPTSGIRPLMVQFTDTSKGNPDTWFWNFGDGQTSTAQNPVHQYNNPGTYSVFLRASNYMGVDSLLKIHYVSVGDSQYAELWASISAPQNLRPGFYYTIYYYYGNGGTWPAYDCTLKVWNPGCFYAPFLYPVFINTGTYDGFIWSAGWWLIPLGTIYPISNSPGGCFRVSAEVYSWISCYGISIGFYASLTSSSPEHYYANNSILQIVPVVCSWDPNDKLASPEGEGDSHGIAPNQQLEYTVQFENKAEATAEAIYIRVVDTLDQDLDWGTLAIGVSSHPDKCAYEFDPYTGVITWFCDSIMLPPNVNPPEGEGYFTFSISPKPDLPEYTTIANDAWIRFDYNPWLQAPQTGPVIRTIQYPFMHGDVNGDAIINLGDVVYLITYQYKNGPAPDPLLAGDVNCDGMVGLGDVVYLITFLYKGGPRPPC
jgi:PKD repeat protein